MLRYDRFIVLEILAKCADRTVVYASDASWIEWDVLAGLQEHRWQIKSDFAALTEHVNELWQATAEGTLFEYISDDPYEPPPSCSFWPLFNEDEIAACASSMGLATSHYSAYSTAPAAIVWAGSGMAFRCQPSIPSGQCRQCRGYGCLVEQNTLRREMIFSSSYCLFCGWRSGSQADHLFSAYTAPLILITQVLEALSRCANLLRIVIAAIAVLLSRLKRFLFQCAIAIAQRDFFTHHGAHPPRLQPLCISGLLRGRVFEFRFAV